MRPLTEEETKVVFEKLSNYIGKNLVHLIDRPDSDAHCFRLHRDRVYYLPLKMMHLATSVGRQNLIAMGTCLGKFSKSGKFKLGVTSLDWLSKYAKYKVGSRGVFFYPSLLLFFPSSLRLLFSCSLPFFGLLQGNRSTLERKAEGKTKGNLQT